MNNSRCIKCDKQLMYVPPDITMIHCGTDYWTRYGERRWKPKICMSCRSEVGRKAQSYQSK